MRISFLSLMTMFAVTNAAVVGLAEAQKSALEKNYGYEIAKQDVSKSELATKSSLSGFFPTATFTASHMLYTPEVNMNSYAFDAGTGAFSSISIAQKDRTAFAFQISQPLFSGGKKWYGYKISIDSEEISRNGFTAETISLLAEVESGYLNVLEMKEMFDISKESLSLSKNNEASAATKHETGLISKVDLLKNSSARATGEVSVLNAEKDYDLAKISFANLTGLKNFELENIERESYAGMIDKLNKYEIDVINSKTEQFLAYAYVNNTDLKNSRLTKSIDEKTVKMAKGNFLPTVSLSYSTEWEKTNLADEFENSGALALSATIPVLPLYDNYITLEKAKIELKKSELKQMQLKDEIRTMINSAVYSLTLESKQLLSTKIAVELAEETYYSVLERSRSGISTADELNTARLSLIQAKYNHTSAFYNMLKTKSELMRLLNMKEEKEFIELL